MKRSAISEFPVSSNIQYYSKSILKYSKFVTSLDGMSITDLISKTFEHFVNYLEYLIKSVQYIELFLNYMFT